MVPVETLHAAIPLALILGFALGVLLASHGRADQS